MIGEYVTIDQAAEVLHMHPNTLRKHCKRGSLCAGKVGKRWLIAVEGIRAKIAMTQRKLKMQI